MHYFYQSHSFQSPYTHTAYQPIARNPLANPNPMHHHTIHHANINPNMRYVAQHNGAQAQRNTGAQQQNRNQQPQNRSPFPAVDPDLLYESANQSNKLMKEASMVLDKLASSKEFGARLMDVAQHSNNEEVERLIHSVGITSDVAITYNPDGLQLEFKSKVKEIDCCKLVVSLRWR